MYGVQADVALHQVLDVFLAGDGLFRFPLAVAGVVLFRVEIEVFGAVFLLADAADDIRARLGEVGLHHVDAGGMVVAHQCVYVGQFDQILVPDLLGHGLADGLVDRAQTAGDLVLKVHGVVDDLEVRVLRPGAQRQIVLFTCDLQRLIARLVAVVIGKFRALGAGNQMQNDIVARHDLLLGLAEAAEHLAEFVVGDIGLVVQQRAVVDHEDVFLRDHIRGLERELLLVDLVCNDKILEFQHGYAVAEGLDAEAGDQLRGGLRDGDDLPALVLFELFQDAADEGGLAGCRAAGQYDAGDFLCQADRSLAFNLIYFTIFFAKLQERQQNTKISCPQ